jgi:protein-L-isoaspartate(D-aspartate) O-methyltransferase
MMLAKPWQQWLFWVGLSAAMIVAAWLGTRAMKDPSSTDDARITAQNAGEGEPSETAEAPNVPEDAETVRARRDMVELQIRARGVRDERVLEAMRRVPRHLFVPESIRHLAYYDSPQRIGHGQTISQPYIVALMTELARPSPDSKALDVGTGSGYQAAILGELCERVLSIEIVEPLADLAQQRLRKLGHDNVTVRCGDGYQGWIEEAPFDLIIVAAAPSHIPQPLIDQLAVGGRLVIPVGDIFQQLIVVEKEPGGKVRQWTVTSVAFVPMTGDGVERRREPASDR